MKKTILRLKPVTETLLRKLERRDLVRRLYPAGKVMDIEPGKEAVDTFYVTAPRYGAHKLMCAGKNNTDIKLTSHPDNEDFLMINPTKRKLKPLLLIIGMEKHKPLEKKAKEGKLTSKDIIAVKLNYNDPGTSFFVILKDTPHWEATLPGRGNPPFFFVAEPARFRMDYIDLYGYDLEVGA